MNFVVKAGDVLIPVAGGVGLELLNDEADIAPILRHFHRAGCRGSFVDIGANVGTVLLALLRIDRHIRYIGFEPSAQAAAYVQSLITLNDVAATHAIYPVALSDACGPVVLQTSGTHDVSATIDPRLRPSSMYHERVCVCASTGDILLRDVESIDVIKIDVEGGESRVLAGLAQTIERHRPALIVEIMPYYHLADGTYPRHYFGTLSEAERERLVANRAQNMEYLGAFFARMGYKLYQMRNAALQSARPSDSTAANQDFVVLPSEGLERFGVAAADASVLAAS